jgi:hypothetical protein
MANTVPDEHLMVFYWRGKLELDGPDDLLTRFYARSDRELGRETIEFIGRSLKNTEGDLEEEVALRLARLWEQRVEVARATNEFTELETFGWWFTSGKLDESWTLRELLATLRLTKQIDPDFLVFEELSRLAPTRPGEVVECLHHMVEGVRDQWKLQAWREEIEKSLRAVLASGDAAARKHAIELVNVLAAKGHVGFRALLGPSVEP